MSSSTDPDNHPAETSRWPLPASGQRTVVPPAVLATMTAHPLCRGCLPHGVGYYPHASGHRMYRANPADDLLIYCVSGQGQLQVEGQTLAVTAGICYCCRKAFPIAIRRTTVIPGVFTGCI